MRANRRLAWCTSVAAFGICFATACGARTSLFFGDSANSVDDGGVVRADASVTTPALRTVSASWSHSCAITGDGHVACWGESIAGGAGPSEPLPTVVSGVSDVVEITAGQEVDCALTAAGATWCWGLGTNGIAQEISGAHFSSMVAGADTVCGTVTGEVACFGAPLLDGTSCGNTLAWNTDLSVVPGFNRILGVAVGQFHGCAFDNDGTTSCWGCAAGDEAQLVWTLGSMAPSTLTPVMVPGVSSTIRIAAATASTCAVQSDGTTMCWGDGSQFARGITIQPTGPRVADFPLHPIDISVGVTFTCAAYADDVMCLGGIPTFAEGCNDRRDDPQSFAVPGITEISVGFEHACARDAQGAVWCWGCNSRGEVGDGTLTPRATPVRVL